MSSASATDVVDFNTALRSDVKTVRENAKILAAIAKLRSATVELFAQELQKQQDSAVKYIEGMLAFNKMLMASIPLVDSAEDEVNALVDKYVASNEDAETAIPLIETLPSVVKLITLATEIGNAKSSLDAMNVDWDLTSFYNGEFGNAKLDKILTRLQETSAPTLENEDVRAEYNIYDVILYFQENIVDWIVDARSGITSGEDQT
jgi:hypothetical protein